MDFTQPKRKRSDEKGTITSTTSRQPTELKTISQNGEDIFLGKLKEILLDLGILTAVEAREHTTVDATIRIVRKLPPLLTALQDKKYKELNEENLSLECVRIFD